MAKDAGYEQCKKWLAEAELERDNAGGRFGFLVTQRAGVGYPRAGEWWAYAKLGDIFYLRTHLDSIDQTVVRMTLSDLVKLIHG
jgi:hypothetical protein